MSDDIAISVQGVSKAYRIWESPVGRLTSPLLENAAGMFPAGSSLAHSLRNRAMRNYKDFWALKDISFEVKKGESVSIIGRNGTGKSTILQIIAGTLQPTAGSVKVNGRIAALLELGSGFNPEFTGRENVYLNGAVLGLSRTAIDNRFEDIANFAEIGDFIEEPVKTYSSGMFVRLAFAVVAHVPADILVIDEALAVGDVFFQQKCMRFLRGFLECGGTVLFVSHDMAAVTSICRTAILLSRNGSDYRVVKGEANEVGKRYLGEIYTERTHSVCAQLRSRQIGDVENLNKTDVAIAHIYTGDEMEAMHIHASPMRTNAESFGLGGGCIEKVYFCDSSGRPMAEFTGETPVNLVIEARALQRIVTPAFGFMIKDRTGQYIFSESTDRPLRHHGILLEAGTPVKAVFSFSMPPLIRGEYTINVAFAEGPGDDHVQHHWIHDAIALDVRGLRLVQGKCGLHEMKMQIEIPQMPSYNE